MNELIIKGSNERLKLIVPCLFFMFLFFSLISYLKSSWSNQTQAVTTTFFFISLFSFWALYIQSKRKVVINKTNDQIQVYETTFWGKENISSYSLSNFAYIRSFITFGRGAVNCVELVTDTGNWGLIISSFLPSGGQKFFSLVTESENPKAKNLCETIASYISLPNMGFQGHELCKTQIKNQNESTFIKNLF
ncbi:MAG TPA: hypothetical protein VES38_10140 [Methylotenera sp.]|nr:hypothetical protein [Methylotenera sp.]